MKYIERPFYSQKIEPFIGKNLIKVITGQRRTGKSCLLFQIMDLIKKNESHCNVIYINKELNEFDHIRNYQDLINYVENEIKSNKLNALMIDEIQDIEVFEKALRHFQAKDNIDVYCTGSNANLLSGDFASLLSGRYIETRVYGLSYIEFLKFFELTDNNESFMRYITYGGLPFLIHLEQEENVLREYLKTIYTTILYKDVIARHKIRNAVFLEKLADFLANNTGNIISSKRISDYLKSQRINISTQVVIEYLKHLQESFLINGVRRSDITGKNLFEIGEKYYFNDTGIKNALCGFNNIQINQLLENVVYNQLRLRGFDITVGKAQDKEIDFICQKQNEKLYVQVAYLLVDEQTRLREFGNLCNIANNYPKIVVSADEFTTDFEGIQHINIRKFLLAV